MTIAAQTGLSPALMHRVAVIGSGTLDILPHNGAVVTLLAVCGMTHGESYFDIVMVGIVSAVLALDRGHRPGLGVRIVLADPQSHSFPGAAQHGAQRSDALQTRDRYKRPVCEGPGSAVQRFALHRVRETSNWRRFVSRTVS